MIGELAEKIISGNIRAIARGISIVESGGAPAYELLNKIYREGNSYIIGFTGPPGAGKSSLIDVAIGFLKKDFDKIGILAVDPSSPFTGGAILGDRIRMQNHAVEPGVFIRSMASRGHLGGIASATKDAIKILKAGGFDLIIVETLGIGQAEVEIVELSDTTILIMVPGLGDDIQVMKSGIMEIADVFAINKSDREGTEKLELEIKQILNDNISGDGFIPPVVKCSARQNKGIDILIESILSHKQFLEGSGIYEKKVRTRIKDDLKTVLQIEIDNFIQNKLDFTKNMDNWIDDIMDESETPYSIIEEIKKLFDKIGE